jgi:Polyketide cyclase / dehydrase and lipid transport
MTKEIRTEILINASPEKVWKVFTDFQDYPGWNPFILSIAGAVEVGNKIKIKLLPPGTKGMTAKSIDWSKVSAALRVLYAGWFAQCPNDKNPIFFIGL